MQEAGVKERHASGPCGTLLSALWECDGAEGIHSPLQEASFKDLLTKVQESIRFFAVMT